jgi:acetyltransferase
MSLHALFDPASVAVIGASATPGKAGYAMARSLAGLPGRLYPVNPRGGHIAGHQAYPSIADVPGDVDLAVLVVPPGVVPGALEECGRAGVRAAVICAGGFAESGDDGRHLQERVRGIARAHGMRVLGPNTSGFMNPPAGVLANFLPGVTALPPGPAAVVAQSGGVNLALCFLAAADGLGIRLGVGLGNAVDVDFHHVLDHLADDDETRVVGLHVEGVAAGRELYEAVGRLSERKPVVALKVGRADVGDFAKSHTGALTGSFALTRAALAQAGAVIVDDPTELADAMRALAVRRLPPRPRPGIGVVTGQAGPGLIIADTLRAGGTAVPELAGPTVTRLAELLPPLTYQRNPVDTGRPGDTFGDVLATVAADPAVDALLVYALEEPDALDPAAALKHLPPDTPVLFAAGGPAPALDTRQATLAPTPLYRSPERAAKAAQALATDAASRHRRATTSPEPPNSPAPPASGGTAKASMTVGNVPSAPAPESSDPAAPPAPGAAAKAARLHREHAGGVPSSGRATDDTGAAAEGAGLLPGVGAAGLGAGAGEAPAIEAPRRREGQRRGAAPDQRRETRQTAAGGDVGGLDEYAAKRLLAEAGVAVPQGRACGSREEAERALGELGGPVVVKILDAGIAHKSDHGAVHTGVRTTADLARALDAIDAVAAGVLGRPARYLVERQAAPGVELIVGAVRDAAFGPVVLLGLGGVGVELAPEPVLRLAPLSDADATDMAGALPGALLAGHRGAPPVDVPAVAGVVRAVASIITGNAGIAELDVNPLRLTPDGPVALDALIVGTPDEPDDSTTPTPKEGHR